MKLTKSDLKLIVKECLVELLNEGLAGSLSSAPSTADPQTHPQTTSAPAVPKPPQPGLQLTPRRPPPQMREAIKREAGGNKIMESIFADTAASTLPMMMQNEGKVHIPSTAGGGLAEQLVASASPEDLFGDEVSSKWASLAFLDSSTKK